MDNGKDNKLRCPVGLEDLWGLTFVSDPEVSPGGTKIVWV